MTKIDILVVGAGFAGATVARKLAEAGRHTLVIDKRSYVGGNAYDKYDQNGVLVHPHGPHIFHTNSELVYNWLSRFTKWRHYEHRVLAWVEGKLLPLPINKTTINRLYGLDLNEAGISAFLEETRQPRSPIKNSEDVVLSSVGTDLCDKFFRHYTQKQWGLELKDLSANVAARIPVRNNDDDRYFTDRFQLMPQRGYTALFEKMLNHPNIQYKTEIDYLKHRDDITARHIIYTGPIDAFFQYQYGKLPYRSLRFRHKHFPNTDFKQPVGTVNYPNDHTYTRITEFKHITGQEHSGTSLVHEYPTDKGDPYYPIPRPENETLYQKYKALALSVKNVHFVGRLAQYRYYNMDQVVAAGLKLAKNLLDGIEDDPRA